MDPTWKSVEGNRALEAQLGSQNPPKLAPKSLKKKRVKTNIDFEAFFVVLFMFFFDFHSRTKIVDFEKIAFSLGKNTFFGVQTVLGKTHV